MLLGFEKMVDPDAASCHASGKPDVIPITSFVPLP
jgi:hypothetical protein